MTTTFRHDNTQGYSDAQLEQLNAEWAAIVEREGLTEEDHEWKHRQEQLLRDFDHEHPPIRPYASGCFEAGGYLDLLVMAENSQFRVVIDAEGDCDPPHEIRVYFGNDDEPCARIDLTAIGQAEAAKV